MVFALSSPATTSSPITLHLHRMGRVYSGPTSSLSTLPIPIPAPSGRFFPLSYRSSNVLGLRWLSGQRAATCCSKLKLVAEGAEQKTNMTARNGSHSRTFLDVSSEAELLSGIKKETEMGRLSTIVASGMEETYWNYRNAVLQSGVPNADEIVLTKMSVMFDRVLLDIEESFEFSPYHRALREPFDYYQFGQNYIRPLIDFSNSYVGNVSLFYEIEEKLQQGHNIILMSNHQTEPDPAVIGLLLETVIPHIVEDMIYVAGDRVITDPLCKPFSMGREGAKVIWIAPSGGRDRPDPITEDWYPAPFDVSSVDNMRRLVEHSGTPGHIYPLAILCYDIMPPPLRVEKEIGEKRVISFHGTGVSVGQEINYRNIADGFETESEAKSAYAQALYGSVTDQYNILNAAVYGKQGLTASTSSVSLSQPWT